MKDKDAAPEVPPMSAEEEAEALSALKSKDLLQILLDAFDSLGYVGEKVNKLIGIIAVVSRLLAEPLALLFSRALAQARPACRMQSVNLYLRNS